MHQFLPFIVIGLATGSVYGLAGVGLVLTYKTSGIFNFAHGSIAALAAFAFYFLRQQHHVPWPIALLLCVAVLAPALGFAFEYLARSLGSAATTIKVLGMIGLVLVVLSVGDLWYPGQARQVTGFLPSTTVRLGGVNVGWDQIIIFGFTVGATGLLYWFFQSARLGAAMRGVVDNPELLARTGTDPIVVRRWAWVIGTCFAAVSGILLAPSLDLDALVLTMLVVQAFGAAAIGYFSSIPITYLGGLAIGIAGSLATKYTASYPSLSGLSPGLPFIILFVVLIVTPRSRLIERAVKPVVEVHRSWFAPTRVRVTVGLVVLIVLGVVPTFAGIRLIAYSNLLATVILILSLGLLVKTSGQISLCHLAFAAVGATSMSHFAHSFGLPWLVSLLLAALVTVPVGALVAIPAIRLSGVFLALATLGFGVLLEQMFYTMSFMFGSSADGIPVPRPGGGIGPWRFGTDDGFYFVLLAFTCVTVLALVVLERGRLGRLLEALADSPVGLQTLGAAANTTRVLVFCLSAFIAGLSGALTASLFQFAVSTQYGSFASLTLFAVVVIVVIGEPWYAFIGAAAMVLVPAYVTGKNTATYLQLLFGVSAATYVFAAKRPLAVPASVRRALDKLGGRTARDSSVPRPPGSRSISQGAADDSRHGSGLVVRELTVRYGGVIAVNAVTLNAPLGTITGLLGPNGAGKSTIFNACSGLIRHAAGSIVFNDQEISSLGPDNRARRGLGRTFQRIDLFDSLTAQENVAMGCEAAMAGGNPTTHLWGSRSDARRIRAAVDEAVEATGINALRNVQVGLLPAGQRRLVELARSLAGQFSLLLLDEPSSGLDADETRHFGDTLRQIVARRGTGILLVEHDMALIEQVCEQVYMVDFGLMIFQGSPQEMRDSAAVRSAYLGTEGVA